MSVVRGWGMIEVDRVVVDCLLLVDKEEEDVGHGLCDVAVIEVVELLLHPPEVVFLLFLACKVRQFRRFRVHGEHDLRRSPLANQAMSCLILLRCFGFW